MLLKYVEDRYPAHITKHTGSDPKHLKGVWVILDHNGVEKVEFSEYKSPYLTKGSCIYHLDNKYFNIETGERYGDNIYKYMESSDFLFLDNTYDQDKAKCGVMKVNKSDGSWELYK